MSLLDDYETTIPKDSPYFDHEDLLKFMKIQNPELLIFSLNCQSFESKFDQLNIFINEINTKTCVSIIALQETWLSELSDISVCQIPNYNIVSSVSKSSKHGSLIFYIHSSFHIPYVAIWNLSFYIR